jgi:predicted nucleic acid-binding protein
MPIICDTNVFINHFAGDEKTTERLKAIGSQNILMPSIAVMELYIGMLNKPELKSMQKKVEQYHVLHLNEAASRASLALIHRYRLTHGLLMPDALIAGMDLAYDLEIFSYNLKDFRYIDGLKFMPL